MKESWDKLIVALDLENKEKIIEIVNLLSPKGAKFKIGSIAFTKFGSDLLKRFVDRGRDIFLDLKLHDIPNTMERTAAIIAEMGCWAFTVHIQVGEDALKAIRSIAEDTAEYMNKRRPLVFGVSVLTSSGATQEEVNRFARIAQAAGLDGVIASSKDVVGIKTEFPELKVITPGIRNPKDDVGDQVRVTTASVAFENGADYIVVGRPIISKKDFLQAAESILKG